jgi:XTP/dITP diphosphohydrolase
MSDKQPRSGLVLATSNQHKLRELVDLLAPLEIRLLSLTDFPNARPIEEDGLTLTENARLKAAGYARQLSRWVLADDTGLEVDALGGAPGVRSARFAGPGATMGQNRAKLLAALERVPQAERTGRFLCHLVVADPAGRIILESTGQCHGRIRSEPAGRGGFGYDALFEVAGRDRTLAELDPRETAAVGHRGRAAAQLLARWRQAMAGV